jgi:hypothetical protein
LHQLTPVYALGNHNFLPATTSSIPINAYSVATWDGAYFDIVR